MSAFIINSETGKVSIIAGSLGSISGGSSTFEGTYNITLPTLSNGESSQLQLTNRGKLLVSGDSTKYVDVATLVTTQDLTASYVDFGAEINMTGHTKLGVWIIADVNTSENCDLRILGKHTSASADEFDVDGVDVKRLWSGVGADFKKYHEFEVGAIPILQIQAKVGTLGSAGNLSILITKVY